MDLAIQNPWWKNKIEIKKDEKVAEALNKKTKVLYKLKDKKNKIILGPRQVGKTSMIKLIMYDMIVNKKIKPLDICYFSCEPLNTKNDIIEVVKEFDKIANGKTYKYIFLDEVTQVPQWELAVKFLIENKISKNKTIISTGSNALLLKKGSERLPGRNISVELFLPLTFKEFLLNFAPENLKQKLTEIKSEEIHKAASKLSIFSDEIEKYFEIYLKSGGYLKAIYEIIEKNKITEETYETYIKWILGDLSKLDRREHIFKSILMGIIKNYTSKFSLHSIAKDTEIKSHVSASDYLDILQSLLLTNQLYQVNINKKAPVFRKEKKNYFLDPFMYSVCKGYINGKYQDYSEDRDKIIEGIICETLARKNRKGLDISSSVWFYLKKKETDFVLKNKELIGIELKYQNNVTKSDFSNPHLFKKRILVCKNQLNYDNEKKLLIIPAHLFLALM